jgi:hypothetical protein
MSLFTNLVIYILETFTINFALAHGTIHKSSPLHSGLISIYVLDIFMSIVV